VLEALIARALTGAGSGIAVSLFDSIADWMSVPLLHYDYSGKAPIRAGLHHATIAPYGAYCCGDGRQVVLSIQNEREWRAFCNDALARPDLAEDARFADNVMRCENRVALDAEIAAIFGSLDAVGVIARLTAAGIAHASLNEVADLSRHAHLRRVSAQTASGPVALPASPIRWNDAPRPAGAVATIGEHSESIRREFA
jgi:crotonobetainyl-CoA:carnitine CoA-transferase CaiB-like acyl-CoA transferase